MFFFHKKKDQSKLKSRSTSAQTKQPQTSIKNEKTGKQKANKQPLIIHCLHTTIFFNLFLFNFLYFFEIVFTEEWDKILPIESFWQFSSSFMHNSTHIETSQNFVHTHIQ